MKVRVKNAEFEEGRMKMRVRRKRKRMRKEEKKGKREKGKKGKGEALRRLINGPWRRGEANKHTGLHCAIAIVCH